MAFVVYLLCTLTSLACAVLLLRAYRQNKVRLLLWSGLCFVGLTLNNMLLLVDLHVLPAYDLFILRSLPTLAGLMLLLYGLIWEAR
ncbi:MAG: hypothetical protein H0T73_15370 [Ardenticatenales bacterium]|nr:hypothetical protein [Ardenticatenales bacterium]